MDSAPVQPIIVRCPSCGERCDVDAQTALRAVEHTWFEKELAQHGRDSSFTPLQEGMRLLACSDHPRWFWACDACMQSGRALVADITKQKLAMGTPFAAYVDRLFRCEDCDTESVFSAQEQLHWYEALGFLIWVYPKQCAPCRSARRRRARTNRDLADALHGLDQTDPDQLEAIARLYDELGRAKKATEYRARAKNRRPS